MKKLSELDPKGKRVLYRPDYNVPVQDGVIQDDFRIQATVPTLTWLIEKGAKIVIASHLGRPDGEVKEEFSLRPVAEVLADIFPNQVVRLAHGIEEEEVKQSIEEMNEGDIFILPNVRFYAEEEKNDPAFAQKLADLADVYVNDAFACDHRAHASIVGVPKLIPGYPGLLLEKELLNLGSLTVDPAHPFVVIMGGAKVSDKIEVIKKLVTKADTLLIGGAMANTFLLAKGEEIGQSKAEIDKQELAKELLEEFGEKLVLAKDYVKDDEESIDFKYLDIGPEAIEQFKDYLGKAKTIFWNGSLGYAEDPQYAIATEAIARYIGSLTGVTSIVAGGDTVETVSSLKLHDSFSFVSTGGGAALELLAGTILPGVEVLG